MNALSIKIANVTSHNSFRAKTIVNALHRKSFLNLQVRFVSALGSFDVWVESDRAESIEELQEMVFGCLIDALR